MMSTADFLFLFRTGTKSKKKFVGRLLDCTRHLSRLTYFQDFLSMKKSISLP